MEKHLKSFGHQAMAQSQDYSKWSHEQLQNRLKLLDTKLERLEEQVAKFESPSPGYHGRKVDCVDSSSTASACHEDTRDRKLPKKARHEKDFDPSKYSNRLIALKLAYLGKNYNGFEYHPNNETPLPTVEEMLWKALMKAKLISPTHNPAIVDGEPNFDGCEYSKCGRTDKGVSAFGQVVGIRVRSNRPLSKEFVQIESKSDGMHEDEKHMATPQIGIAAAALKDGEIAEDMLSSTRTLTLDEETITFNPVDDEIPYCEVINRLLPSDIRILAWCPSPPIDFSARFSCGERQYTYFFTQPAFTPMDGVADGFWSRRENEHEYRRQGYLDVSTMQAAAKKFEGTHDFRNFCKVDASKQLDNFERRIFHSSIVEQNSSDKISISNLPASYVSDPAFEEFANPIQSRSLHRPAPPETNANTTPISQGPRLYAFHLHGNAFLWHQVRHMVAILFLIGQGLESPSLIDELFDVSKNPRKPQYEMADGIPLVLSNCVFPRQRSSALDPFTGSAEDAMEWVYVGSDREAGSRFSQRRKGPVARGGGRYGVGGLVDELWRVWRGRKMDEVLAGRLLDVAARQGNQGGDALEEENGGGDEYESQSGTKTEKRPNHHSGYRRGNSGNGIKGKETLSSSQKIFQGADKVKYVGTYVPVLEKPRMELVEVINERYREKKGFNVQDEARADGWRKVPLLGRRVDGVA